LSIYVTFQQPHLLVSVRDAAEAVAALAGGADLIDVKEPSRGALGRADAATIASVVQAVAGRAPISAALGELREWYPVGEGTGFLTGVKFVKWGLSRLLRGRWARGLFKAAQALPDCEPVPVAYADWIRAVGPRPADVAAGAGELAITGTLLIDTFQKDGSSLLDWISLDEIAALVQTCRQFGMKVALAGSLTAVEIERLRGVRPDWFAVRGAVCDGGRGGTVSERRVRELADLIHSF
jgi:uncharacterized protein (UPF0264 family)